MISEFLERSIALRGKWRTGSIGIALEDRRLLKRIFCQALTHAQLPVIHAVPKFIKVVKEFVVNFAPRVWYIRKLDKVQIWLLYISCTTYKQICDIHVLL